MQVPEYPGLTRVQERAIKIAVEGTCELCSEYFALPLLEIHRISRRLYREMVRDPSARILVVCGPCHQHIHRLPVRVKDQRAIVSRRPYFVRQELRKALGYTPKPYSPPETSALSEMYEEYFYHFPPGSFRLGG
ncbi:hypothetical protein [Methanoregula sp.]|uniref:hypothetical protein n=1 Tax=Methanoregula sp. TaxID=2052170 RepID=UPI003BAFD786